MRKALTKSFYDRPTLAVAKTLLGKYLVRRYRGKTIALMVTEVEAYDGPRDMASHASRGRTPRNHLMFGEAGRFYVYFTYGMHWLANIVTGPGGYPAAVLIRAGVSKDPRTGALREVHGPARVTKFLHIGTAENGKHASKRNGLWFEDRSVIIPRKAIVARKRVGVDYAGPVWANKKYNFALRDSTLRRMLIFSARPSSRASRPRSRTR
ncbi:MAG: DNA-3-methyladenine glycosylase [Minisyncoccia bacterium]|jgi:DNA-3-methyladenine glycosylase